MGKILQLEPVPARAAFRESMWKSDRYIAEEKYDGSRYLMHINKDSSRFTSRRISVKTDEYVEKTENLPHLNWVALKHLKLKDYTVLDGEILTDGGTSYDVTSVMGSLPDKAIELQKEKSWVHYYVFDILFHNGKDVRNLPFGKRRRIIKELLEIILQWKHTNVEHFHLTPQKRFNKKKFYEGIVKKGREGIILKDLDASYGQGWIKIKKMRAFDVVIMGYLSARKYTEKVDGKVSLSKFYRKGWIGAIRFGQYVNGNLKEMGTCSGIDEGLRAEISNDKKKFLNKVIEVSGQFRLPSGHIRHPQFSRFRDDKNPKDCVYRKMEA